MQLKLSEISIEYLEKTEAKEIERGRKGMD